MGMHVVISRLVLAAIVADARADMANERCGLLLGTASEITHFRPTRNVHPEPSRFFEVDPATLIAAHRDARYGQPAVVGHYHSHPSGKAEPSIHDARLADDDRQLWLIVSEDSAALWRSRQGGEHCSMFDPVMLDVIPTTALAPVVEPP
jgi:desampylase